MPDIVINKITEQATRQGYTGGEDPTLEFIQALEEDMDNGALPEMMEIDGRLDKHEELANFDVAAELETSTWNGGAARCRCRSRARLSLSLSRSSSLPTRSTDNSSTRKFLSNKFV